MHPTEGETRKKHHGQDFRATFQDRRGTRKVRGVVWSVPSRGAPSSSMKTSKGPPPRKHIDPPFTLRRIVVARGATGAKSGKAWCSAVQPADVCMRVEAQCELIIDRQECSTSTGNASGTLGSLWSGSARRCSLFLPCPSFKPFTDGIPRRWMRRTQLLNRLNATYSWGKRAIPRVGIMNIFSTPGEIRCNFQLA